MRLALLTALVMWLPVFGSPAARADVPPASWEVKALGLAQAVWHPGCGALSVRYVDPDAAGVVVINDAPGPDQGQRVYGALGFTEQKSCVLGINSTHSWRGSGYPAYCTTVLHEAGRAAGMPGTNGPGVMNVQASPSRDVAHFSRNGKRQRKVIWSGVDRRCVRPMDVTPISG